MKKGSEEIRNDLMAYLYDEMTSGQRIRFEDMMAADPALQKEFEQLKSIRGGLSELEDKEVVEPFYLWGRNGIRDWPVSYKRKQWILLRPVLAVAASIVLILLAGYLTDFSVSWQRDSLIIGFNKNPVTDNVKSLSREEISGLIQDEIAKNNSALLTGLESNRGDLESRIASIEQKQQENTSRRKTTEGSTQKQLDIYLTQIKNTNARLMENFLKSATLQQQEYFQTVLTEFTEYMQEQRTEDLRIISRNLVNLKENQDKQKQETQQILTTLINNTKISNN